MKRIYVFAIALAVSVSACVEKDDSKDDSAESSKDQGSTSVETAEAANEVAETPQGGERVLADPNKFSEVIKDSNVVLIDLRTPGELEGGMIEGAVHVDFMADGFQEKLKDMDQSKTYAVYCAGGGRSGKASNQMKEMGFAKVYDLDGGFGAWQSGGFPIASE